MKYLLLALPCLLIACGGSPDNNYYVTLGASAPEVGASAPTPSPAASEPEDTPPVKECKDKEHHDDKGKKCDGNEGKDKHD